MRSGAHHSLTHKAEGVYAPNVLHCDTDSGTGHGWRGSVERSSTAMAATQWSVQQQWVAASISSKNGGRATEVLPSWRRETLGGCGAIGQPVRVRDTYRRIQGNELARGLGEQRPTTSTGWNTRQLGLSPRESSGREEKRDGMPICLLVHTRLELGQTTAGLAAASPL